MRLLKYHKVVSRMLFVSMCITGQNRHGPGGQGRSIEAESTSGRGVEDLEAEAVGAALAAREPRVLLQGEREKEMRE